MPEDSLTNTYPKGLINIHCDDSQSSAQDFAARELRRYIHERCGEWATIENAGGEDTNHSVTLGIDKNLSLECYRLIGDRQMQRLRIVGGNATGLLYGVYRFVELMGVRFYLHGDSIPSAQVSFTIPDVEEDGSPEFELRGVQPFHDFPEGPDWWTQADYQLVLGQLLKLRMNFIGLHVYPFRHSSGPELGIWIGPEGDVNADGSVNSAYHADYFHTRKGSWGYSPMDTSEYFAGAAQLFDRDVHGVGAMEHSPQDADGEAEYIKRFGRQADFFGKIFGFARKLGVRTCLGTEGPLSIPDVVSERSSLDGAELKRDLYRGVFSRIARTHSLDYYWPWTSEDWTWNSPGKDRVDAYVEDLNIAIEVAAEIMPELKFATAGWVLGPAFDRAYIGKQLPAGVAMSAIARDFGEEPPTLEFGNLKDRDGWAISWFESDTALIHPQLYAGRMLRDAREAHALGCEGLMGLHWRLRINAPNVAALARSAWNLPKAIDGDADKVEAGEGFRNGMVRYHYELEYLEGCDVSLFHTELFDFEYVRVLLPNGVYTVTLGLIASDHTVTRAGEKVLDYSVQGKTVFEKVDVFAEVGQGVPVFKEVQEVIVSDGTLLVGCHAHEGSTSLYTLVASGVSESGDVVSRSLNCGGHATDEFELFTHQLHTPRELHMPAGDFYRDWATTEFGSEVADQAAEMFASIDGAFPVASHWNGGPGGIVPDNRAWSVVEAEFDWLLTFEALAEKVVGATERENFEFWLQSFRFQRELARLRCLAWDADLALKAENAENAKLACERLVRATEHAVTVLLAGVSDVSGLGTTANFMQHVRIHLIDARLDHLRDIVGALPDSMNLSSAYRGEDRLIVPTRVNSINQAEDFRLTCLVLTAGEVVAPDVHWRSFGSQSSQSASVTHCGRGVFEAVVSAEQIGGGDFEYWVEIPNSAEHLSFPASAPQRWQSVVQVPVSL